MLKESPREMIPVQDRDNIFEEGKNCWKAVTARHASVLVDCGNYYRDLHQSITKAKHSIFILGWDIDGRIKLLRGEDEKKAEAPAKLSDLLKWKVAQNPDIRIYLNSWDYTFIFSKTREPFFDLRWEDEEFKDKLFFRFDDLVPLGASHHQKIIIVDDETAFCGGMDIAFGRWDFRDHSPKNKKRKDRTGFHKGQQHTAFGPYHDIQMVVSGEAADVLNDLVRARWAAVSDIKPVPKREVDFKAFPESWPDSDGVDFKDIDVAISRTAPEFGQHKVVREIEQMYLDRIAQAEKFIYIENQYVAAPQIAEALNKQLRAKPDLRVLIVSTFKAPGVVEQNSMWPGRIYFRQIIEAGIDPERVVMAGPFSGTETVHIHSKFMVVDDKYISIGSANINNRSMGFDTECDITMHGVTDEARAKIADIRNDLIREHMGMEKDEIQAIIDRGENPSRFLERIPESQYLQRLEDEKIAQYNTVSNIILRLTDPCTPLIPEPLVMPAEYSNAHKTFKRRLKYAVLVALAALAFVCLWRLTPLSDLAEAGALTAMLEDMTRSNYAAPIILTMFVIGGQIFFPVTVMIAATAAVIGPIYGFALAMAGSLLSAGVGYGLGAAMGAKFLQKILGQKFRGVAKRIKASGTIGITVLRMTPIAPFTAVNLALGVSRVSFIPYMAGTFLGLLPGITVLSILGESFADFLRDATWGNFAYVGGGILLWIIALVGVHFLAKKLQDKYAPASHD